MQKELLTIVREGISLDQSIDRNKLFKYTERYAEVDIVDLWEELTETLWKNLRHLHVFWDHSLSMKDNYPAALSSGCYVSLDESWALLLNISEKVVQRIIKECEHNLLLFNFQNGDDFCLDLSPMNNLKHLRIVKYTGRGKGHLVDGVQQLLHLESLKLWGIMWNGELDLSVLSELKSLDIDTGRYATVSGFSTLANLEELGISGECTGKKLDLSNLVRLKKLSIYNNGGTLEQIIGLHHTPNLEEIFLHRVNIRNIPEDIRQLKKLRQLYLNDLELDALPDWLPELKLPFSTSYSGNSIILEDVEVPSVNMDIFNRPQDVILQWFKERKKGNTVPLNEVKVVFLGDGEAGKTHTIARLLANGEKPTDDNFDGKATPGIVIKNKEYKLDGKKIQVHFWDFGGQEILHSMHRMFLTDRTLYVVIINARDDTQDDRARYWLHNIKSFAGSAPGASGAQQDRPEPQRLHRHPQSSEDVRRSEGSC